MPQFTVNAERVDPYKSHAFRVRWDGEFVPGITRVGPLGWSLATPAPGDPVSEENSDPPQLSGVRYVPVQLERGRTHDDAFETWAALVSGGGTRRGAAPDPAKDVEVQLLNEAGQLAMTFLLRGCLPVEYVALGAMDANTNGVAVETLTLSYRSLGRDKSVREPREP